ncbi:MAG: hypothetical protein RL333_750 [Pseudomonadota bacterium]|jgi:hypothetical protein
MKLKAKVASLLIVGLFTISPSMAVADVVLSNAFDPATGTIEIGLSIDPTPNALRHFKFSLDYSSELVTFTMASFPNANTTSYAGSQAGSSGLVSGEAEVDFAKGNTAVKLYFLAQGPGSLNGSFQSILVDGKEMGPISLPNTTFDGYVPTTPTTATVSRKDIIANGINHALAMHWSHPQDGVSGFRAEAWVLQSAGRMTGPVAHCDVSGTERMCIIPGLRNGRIYMAIVKSIYPDGTILSSDMSEPAIPFPSNVNGRCSTRFVIKPEKPLSSRRMCKKGQISSYTYDGMTASWLCVGLGHGETQMCSSP